MRLTLSQLKRRATHARQAHVSWKGFRGRRLQQLGEKLQSNEAYKQYDSSLSRKLPANAQSHAPLSPQRNEFAPRNLSRGRGGGVPPAQRRPFFAPITISDGRQVQGEKPSKQEGHPRPSYATASRNSAMSFNCSSTQSPGLRE
jgi:hypothetical protein